MNRILTFSLLASSMLVAAVPALAQERSSNRGDWIRAQTQQRQQSQSDGGERQRPQRVERQQQAPQQRTPSAVTTQRVPPSTAQSNWRQSREGQARPERGGENRRFEGRRPDAPSGVVTPQAQRGERDGRRDWNRDNAARPDRNQPDRNWTTENRRPGVVTNRDFDRNRGDDARRQRDWRNDRDGREGRNWSDGGGDLHRGYNYQGRLNDRDRWSGQRRWDNNGWRNDRRYDWQRYRTQYRQVYRLPSYAAPYGWDYGYRRFSIGINLNSILFGSNYWIDDPYRYRLPPAYGTLRWVRYYDDALLVDVRDGYVVDVLHDFFW